MANLKEKQCTDFFESVFEHNQYLLEGNKVDNHYIVDSILIAVKVRGASGGSCWGTHATSFTVDYEDRKNNLSEELQYYSALQQLLSHGQYDSIEQYIEVFQNVADENIHNSIATKSDYYDYYGNGNEYEIIAIPIFSFMKKFLNQEDFSTLKKVYSYTKSTQMEDLELSHKIEELNTITHKLLDFEKNSEKDLVNIQGNIRNLKNNLKYWEGLLANFETTKNQEKLLLENKRQDLENQGISLPILKNNKYNF